MKNRKPLIIALMIILCLALVLGVMAACNKNDRDRKLNVIESDDGYEWTYNQNFVDEMDADMKIDGNLDEARWNENGKKWLTHTEKNVNMRYTTVFTAKGLYIAAEAADPSMQWNETRNFANNSSFYFYVISQNATEYHAFDCMGFYVDEFNSACRQNTRFAAKASRTVNGSGVPVLTAEFFSSWKALGYDVDETSGIPESAKFIPQYRYVEQAGSKENAYLKPALAEVGSNKVNNAYRFSKDGYINVDVEGAEIGNGDNGFAKSDGWDLSAVKGDANGVKKITSNVYGDQAIFFKGINSSRYSYTVDIEYKQTYGNTAFPAAGVLDMKDANDFNIVRFHGKDITSNSNNYRYFRLDFHNGRSDNQQGNLAVTPGTRKITVRVIKDNSRYYYIFGGYEYGVELSWLDGKTIPGLYTFDAEVEFSNWQVTDYEGEAKDEAFEELCAQYMSAVKVDNTISGGTVSVDKLAVKKGSGEQVNLTVTPTRGYVLTDITVNGESQYEELLSQMVDGVIALTPDKALDINATFSAMPAAETIRITGALKRSTGDNLIGRAYSVRSNDPTSAKLLYNYGTTTSAGMFDITLLRAGTHNIGGRQITTDGKYTFTIDGIFPRDESNQFVIDTAAEELTDKSYFNWGDVVVNPLKVANMAENDDGLIQTTHTVYDKSQIFSYFIGNDIVTGNFQLDMTISAKNDKWPCYGFTIEDENNNSLQLFAAGATTFRIMEGYDGVNYTQTDKSATFVNGVSRIKLIYSEKDDTFSFYVNDVLFATLNRTKYLTGTQFKYGPVGYMSGADGSNTPVTADNPFATFTKPTLVKEFTVTVPEGATIEINGGEEITNGKVPVLSTITVTIPVADDKLYTIYLDGSPLETNAKDGAISATFDVKANCTVTYELSCEISGTVSFGDKYPELQQDVSLEGTEILVAGENGSVIYTAVADADGNFKAILPDGKFYVGAKGGTLVSDSLELTVENGEASQEVSLKLTKPAVREQLFGLELNYDAKTGNYVSDYAHGQKAAGYLAGASAEANKAYAVTVTMKNLGSDWPSGGFAIGTTSDKFVKFEIVKADDGTYILRIKDELSNGEALWWFRNIDEFKKYNSLTEFEFTVVYSNGNYYVFLQGDLLVSVPETTALGGTTIKASVGSGKNVYMGLYGEEKITFADWTYTYASQDIKALIGRKLTLGDGITAEANGNDVADGDVLLGDEVTVSVNVPAGKIYSFVVDGKAVDTMIEIGVATATFKVTGNHNVSYSVTYAVSGTTAANATVTFANADCSIVKQVQADQNGAFSWALPNGNYFVTSKTDTHISSVVTVSVEDAAVETEDLIPNKPLITENVTIGGDGVFNINYAVGGYTTDSEPNHAAYFATADNAANGLVVTVTVNKFTADWYSAGFTVATAEGNARFVLRVRPDQNPRRYDGSSWADGKTHYDFLNADVFDPDLANPFDGVDELTFNLVYNNGIYYFLIGDKVAYKVTDYSAPTGKVGFFCEREITYKDWKYSTDADEIGKLIGATIKTQGEGIALKVGDKTIADGKVLLGDLVTVNVAVQAGQNVAILVDGKAIDTKTADNVAAATFKVTGDHVVTYSVTYTVSGTTAANATVTFANADGGIVKQLQTDGNGAFSWALPNGTYYLTACTDTCISSAVTVVVDGAAQNGVIVKAELLKLLPQPIPNGWGVDTGEYIYDLVTGQYHGSQGTFYTGRFAGVSVPSGSTWAASATLNIRSTTQWPSAGILLMGENPATQNVKFEIVRNTDANPNVYLFRVRDLASGSDNQTTFAINYNPDNLEWLKNNQDKFGENVKLTVVSNNSNYYLFIGDELAFAVTGEDANKVTAALGAGNISAGFYCEHDVAFADWSFTAETETISNFIGKTVESQGDNITLKVGDKTITDGKVLLGDLVTVNIAVQAGQNVAILVDGKAIDTTTADNVAAATFKVTGNHSVTYSVTYTVSGTTVANATVIFANADGSIVKQLQTGDNGAFSWQLPYGSYYVTAQTDAQISSVVEVTVNGAAQEVEGLTLGKPLVTELVYADNLVLNYATGELSKGDEPQFAGGFFNGVTVAKDNDFELSVTMKGMSGIWPSAGLLVGSSATEYARFDLIHNTNSDWYGLQVNNGSDVLLTWLNNSVFAKPFGDDGTDALTLKLVHHSGVYSMYFNGILVGQTSNLSFTTDTVKLGIYGERSITFTDWSYKTDNVEVPADARLKGFDGVTAFNYDTNSGLFKSVWGNSNQRSVTDIDVKDVSEWVYSADLHVMSDANWPSVGLALYNSDNSAEYIVKIIRNCSNATPADQWCQLKIGVDDFGADANGNSTQQWVEAHKMDMKNEVNMALVHNAKGYYLFINNDLVWSVTGDAASAIASGWDNVYLGLFAEQETSARNIRYSTDISGYEIPA